MNSHDRGKTVSFLKALRLKCPYCGISSLLEKKSFLKYAKGCDLCGYKYLREESYYAGVSQLVCFPISCVASLIAAASLYVFTDWELYQILLTTFILVIGFTLAIWPFCLGVWLWLDHRFRPLFEQPPED